MSQKAQIHGRDRAQKEEGSAAVRQGMEYLKRNTLLIIIDADQVAIVGAEIHVHARILNIRLNEGTRAVVRFEVTPENALAKRRLEGRESRERHVHCFLQQIGLDRFF